MKKFVLLFLVITIALPLLSQEDQYKINLQLTGLPDTSIIVLLQHKKFDDFNQEKITDKAFEKTYTGKVTEITPFYVIIYKIQDESISQMGDIRLFIGNEEVTIKGTPDNYEINTDSKTQKIFEQWKDKTREVREKHRKLMGDLYDMYQQPDSDSADYARLSNEYHKYLDKDHELTKEFVKNHPNSETAVFLLNKIKQHFPFDTIKKISQMIPEKYFDSEIGKDLQLFISITPLEVGQDWLDFEAFDIAGDTAFLSERDEIQGKHVLLVFSSPGCQGCEMAVPELKEVYEAYRDQIELVTYNQAYTLPELKSRAEAKDIEWTYLGTEESDKETMYKYGSYGTPKFVLISPERKITYSWEMGFKRGVIKNKLKELME